MRILLTFTILVLLHTSGVSGSILEYRFSGWLNHVLGPDTGLDGASMWIAIRVDVDAVPITYSSTFCCCDGAVYWSLDDTATFTVMGSAQSDGTFVYGGRHRVNVYHGIACQGNLGLFSIMFNTNDFPIPGHESDFFDLRLTFHPGVAFESALVPDDLSLSGGFSSVVNNSRIETCDGISCNWHYLFVLENIETVVLSEPADFNEDRQNDLDDYHVFSTYLCHWSCDEVGVCYCEPPLAFDPLADFDEDGDVDLRDVAGFQRSYTGVPIVGDMNNDRYVYWLDFARFHQDGFCNWPCLVSTFDFTPDPPCDSLDPSVRLSICDPPAIPHPRADIDKDGDSDFFDFALFQNAFGTGE